MTSSKEDNNPKGLVIAGLSGGSGKSMVSVGLCRALLNKGSRVVPFKKGPDYIDAGWLTAASKNPCYNLDPYLTSPKVLMNSFQTHLYDAEYGIVEGNRGIFDGVNPEGEFSTAALAKQLGLPVLLVVNCSKTTRTIGALVLGCCNFDPDVEYAGVILNQIATTRHETIIRKVIETYTPLSVVGIMPRLREDIFPMRHLGVVPLQEYANAEAAVTKLASLAQTNFDIPSIDQRMEKITLAPCSDSVLVPAVSKKGDVKIGVLRDAAFQFYYEENLEILRSEGAELVMINALTAKELPRNIDGLYIGGGFPETSAKELAANKSFRKSILSNIEKGLPVYAECGGLIFLGSSIIIEDVEYPLVDCFPITFGFSKKPQAHGYSSFTVNKENSFYKIGETVKGHEFRYSTVERWLGDDADLAVTMNRGTGFVNGKDGLVKKNVLAMYTHVLGPGTIAWAKGFLKAVRKFKSQ